MLVSGFVPVAFVSNCILQMYARCADAVYARRVFDAMPRRDTVSWNTMLTAHCVHSGDITTAISLFDAMPNPDAVSWNALISSYCQRGMYRESVPLFLEMAHSGVASDWTTFAVLLKSRDDFTYGSVLKACAALQSLEFRLIVHDKVIKSELGSDAFVASTVVDMCCKCGMMTDAQKLHDRIGRQELVS
ncbi:hypothetical protein ACQ4PT_048832 [Festuca glaucescens]